MSISKPNIITKTLQFSGVLVIQAKLAEGTTRISANYNPSLSEESNHTAMAHDLAKRLGHVGPYVSGKCAPNSYLHICCANTQLWSVV